MRYILSGNVDLPSWGHYLTIIQNADRVLQGFILGIVAKDMSRGVSNHLGIPCLALSFVGA